MVLACTDKTGRPRRRAVNRSAARLLSRVGGMILTAVTAYLGGASYATADVRQEYGASVVVENVYATAGHVGDSAFLRFRIVNDSRDDLHLVGLTTDVAPSARLLADVGKDQPAVLESIGIPAESTLDLTTSHLRYELHPLRVDLVPGSTFPIVLRFVNGRIQTEAHVHDR